MSLSLVNEIGVEQQEAWHLVGLKLGPGVSEALPQVSFAMALFSMFFRDKRV